MLTDNLDLDGFNNYITLLPNIDYDIKESVEYCFNNVIFLDASFKENTIKELVEIVNKKINMLIIFDWHELYNLILPYISKNKKIKCVFKSSIAQLTGWNRNVFFNILEYYNNGSINEIACLDDETNKVLRNAGYNTTKILLDVRTKTRKSIKSNSVGIIGNDYDPNHNIYNQLSALKLINYTYAKIVEFLPATKKFINELELRIKQVSNVEEAFVDNDVNLYCNFAATNYELVLKSMDLGIPCLLGNTNIFDNFPILKKYLVLECKDDISEIANKIDLIRKDKQVIISEYRKFRKKYAEQSQMTISSFLSENSMVDLKITSIEMTNNEINIKYDFSPKLKKFFIKKTSFNLYYYNTISKVPKSIAVIPFISTIIPIIWLTDSTIEIDELDSDFYYCLQKVQKALDAMYPNCGFLNGRIICKKIQKNKPLYQKKSSIFYSGGVDSLSSLISVLKEKPILITIWGSDIFLNDKEGWKTAISINNEIAHTFNLENYYIKSNFREIINEEQLNAYFQNLLNDTWWHGVEHGLALLGHVSILSYKYGIKTHYIPATYSFREKNVTCASYPTIDENVKYCGCSIVHEGFNKNRQEKITQICNYVKKTHKKIIIRSCYMQRNDEINCCRCEKCYRTIMGIIAEKQNPREYGFNISDKDIGVIKYKLNQVLENNKKAKWHWIDIQKRCIENKDFIEHNKYYRWILTYNFE